MRILKDIILKPIEAQSATETDAVAQPTFFTDIDFSQAGGGVTDPPTSIPTGDGNGKITLSADATSFVIGSTFDVKVNIDSDGELLSAYTVKIEYNSSLIQVVDVDTTLSGTQVEFTDTAFNEVENTVNTTTGAITIKGESPTAKTKNGEVANITFTVLSEGAAEITVVKSESSLVNDASTNVLSTTNGLQISAGDSIGQAGELIDEPLLPQGLISNVDKLPDSALPFGGLFYMVLGVLLIAVGLRARQISNKSLRKN